MLKNTALILIDIQNDYFKNGKYELHNSKKAAINSKKILDFFRSHNLEIIHIQHLNTTMQDVAPYFIPNTNGVEFYELVKPMNEETIVTKNTPNSFLNTNLENILLKKNIKELVICGMMSHMCIDTTVRAAKALNFNITVIHDACTCPNITWNNNKLDAVTIHQVIMASLDGAFANTVSSNEWITNNLNKF